MKSVLIFILPAIVFFLVFSSFSQLSGSFFSFTALLLVLVCLSNFSGVMFAYPVGFIVQDFITSHHIINNSSEELSALYDFNLPTLCSNSTALIFGIIMGLYTGAQNNKKLKTFAKHGSNFVNIFLRKIFTPILPIFILGFLLKAQHDKMLIVLFKNFAPLLSVILAVHFLYIGTLYLAANSFHINKTISSLKNIFPALILGFSSMSSSAAMPALITGTSKNAKDKNGSKIIIPFLTNIHMQGDSLAIPFMAFSLYVLEYNQFPSLDQYIFFAISYTIAKFASAGIPGGTILIMTPVLESKLGFTSEMSAIILTIYLLFDMLCTASNILGNGVFAMIFEKIKLRILKDK